MFRLRLGFDGPIGRVYIEEWVMPVWLGVGMVRLTEPVKQNKINRRFLVYYLYKQKT